MYRNSAQKECKQYAVQIVSIVMWISTASVGCEQPRGVREREREREIERMIDCLTIKAGALFGANTLLAIKAFPFLSSLTPHLIIPG